MYKNTRWKIMFIPHSRCSDSHQRSNQFVQCSSGMFCAHLNMYTYICIYKCAYIHIHSYFYKGRDPRYISFSILIFFHLNICLDDIYIKNCLLVNEVYLTDNLLFVSLGLRLALFSYVINYVCFLSMNCL